MNPNLTLNDLIAWIAGPDVEVQEIPLVGCVGAMANPWLPTPAVFLPSTENDGGWGLMCALHEACHIYRAREGMAFYRNRFNTWHPVRLWKEEVATNRMAIAYLPYLVENGFTTAAQAEKMARCLKALGENYHPVSQWAAGLIIGGRSLQVLLARYQTEQPLNGKVGLQVVMEQLHGYVTEIRCRHGL